MPDQIYTGVDQLHWYQTRTFSPPILVQDSTDICVTISVDLASGPAFLRFYASDYIRTFEDGSNLFRCFLNTKHELSPDGTAREVGGRLIMRLYHHTSDDAKSLILTSQVLRASRWNFQGTKQLTNVGYVYLTSLPKIRTDLDLKHIAMASDGKIYLICDDAPAPISSIYAKPRIGIDILELDVYRENTMNRRATLPFDVDATLLAPQYLYRHMPHGSSAYYEVCNYRIQRIGIQPDGSIPHDGRTLSVTYSQCISTDYIVVGDATSVEGLKAPYDEEDTKFIMKLERMLAGTNIAQFWFNHGNADLYTPKEVKLQTFKSDIIERTEGPSRLPVPDDASAV